jgi:hypothetical protein
MPKLGAAWAETVQLEFPDLPDFRRFPRVLLVRVSPEMALIKVARPSRRHLAAWPIQPE